MWDFPVVNVSPEMWIKNNSPQYKADMETKYSDGDIRAEINSAKYACDYGQNAEALARSSLAQAMVAYNNMVEARWM